MSRLRKKIEPNPQFPIYIQTVPGHGYKFCPQSSNNK
ncbi:MAG: winged helix-turn-helix domain-containing protein [Clostridium sp.]|nr:winged helix-turn-helix domain-containing protein [Clostridium sp.]